MDIINPNTDDPCDVRIMSYYREDNIDDDCGTLLVSVNHLQETTKYYEDLGYHVKIDKMKLSITSMTYDSEVP